MKWSREVRGKVLLMSSMCGDIEPSPSTPEPLVGGRNFDPISRTLKKRTNADELEDTVEKNVKGLAEMIIAEDEEKRQQELVRLRLLHTLNSI